jgi:hypothetical protein
MGTSPAPGGGWAVVENYPPPGKWSSGITNSGRGA